MAGFTRDSGTCQEEMDGLEDICRVRVRFSEIDSMRRAWHGAYVAFFEDGRESFGRHYPGIGYADMQQAGVYAPVYELHVKFYAPLALDDVAAIHTLYKFRPGARLDFGYRIFRESDGILCAEGSTVQLFVDDGGTLMVDKPACYEEWQGRHLGRAAHNP